MQTRPRSSLWRPRPSRPRAVGGTGRGPGRAMAERPGKALDSGPSEPGTMRGQGAPSQQHFLEQDPVSRGRLTQAASGGFR